MKTIRPHQLFSALKEESNHYFNVLLPTLNNGSTGPLFVELAIMATLLKLTNPKNIFEFGTLFGITSTFFALNTDHNAKIFTLDIPRDFNKKSVDPVDREMQELSLQNHAFFIKKAQVDVSDKITCLFCDSNLLDTKPYKNMFDFIFIDGAHDYNTVKNDTLKAYEMAKDGAVVVWHDYASKKHPDVTRFVNEFESVRGKSFIHVGDTMLAFDASEEL